MDERTQPFLIMMMVKMKLMMMRMMTTQLEIVIWIVVHSQRYSTIWPLAIIIVMSARINMKAIKTFGSNWYVQHVWQSEYNILVRINVIACDTWIHGWPQLWSSNGDDEPTDQSNVAAAAAARLVSFPILICLKSVGKDLFETFHSISRSGVFAKRNADGLTFRRLLCTRYLQKDRCIQFQLKYDWMQKNMANLLNSPWFMAWTHDRQFLWLWYSFFSFDIFCMFILFLSSTDLDFFYFSAK